MADRASRNIIAEATNSSARTVSHGRGGAGNLGKDDPNTEQPSLETPFIKSDKYTTGRGGSGNIAKNDPSHPEIARAAQDVAAVKIKEDHGPVHIGRGGAANTAKQGEVLREGERKPGFVSHVLEKVGLKK